jgi:hypothetical protein
MSTRTMARLSRTPTPHTDWCTRDHRCGVNEHRSADITADEIGGRAWITRVRAGDREYAEIRARIPLHPNDTLARWQIATALNLMRELLTTIAARLIALPTRNRRPAIDRRHAA